MSKQPDERILSATDLKQKLYEIINKRGLSWFVDVTNDNRFQMNEIRQLLFSKQTKHQKLDIIDTFFFGLCLVLDGRIQLAELDEFIYHEMLIHPAMVYRYPVRNILILGGGDGCALREVLRWKTVEHAVLVDIDEDIIKVFRDQFPHLNHNAYKDPRSEVYCEDAYKFISTNSQQWDLIIGDLTEPFDETGIAGELSFHLFKPEFCRMVLSKMSPGGVMVVQTGGIQCHPELDSYHQKLVNKFHASFSHLLTAYEFIPSFDEMWSVSIMSEKTFNPINAMQVDEILIRGGVKGLRYYDGITHQRLFSVPRFLR